MPHVMEGLSLSLSRGESQSLYTTPLLLLLTETNNNDHKTQGDLYSFLLEPKYPKKKNLLSFFFVLWPTTCLFLFIFFFLSSHSVCLSANVGNKSFIFGLAVNLIFRVTQTFRGNIIFRGAPGEPGLKQWVELYSVNFEDNHGTQRWRTVNYTRIHTHTVSASWNDKIRRNKFNLFMFSKEQYSSKTVSAWFTGWHFKSTLSSQISPQLFKAANRLCNLQQQK